MNVTVRATVVEDVETLFDIRTSVSQNHLSREELAAMGITPETAAAAIASGERHGWIAELDGFAAAFSMADAQEGTVFAMFVRPGYEGRGLGRLLMAEAEAFLFERHAVIWLTTDGREEVRANGFYRRLGWKMAGAAEGEDVRCEKEALGSPCRAGALSNT
jgi:GNAT superfamily N-acetyltransferase